MKNGLLQSITDEDLIRRFQADPEGSEGEAAAEALFGRYLRRVYAWCRRYLRDHERALDTAQEVLASAWRALPGFDHRSPFACWLFVIARNRCYSAMRPVSLTRDEDEDPDGLVDVRPGPDEVLERQEDEASMLKLIGDTLDRLEQDALVLRCFERLPVDEITRALDLQSASGARGLLQTARRKLRTALDARRGGAQIEART
jgi:RNA polymerase sigma factor (sigma-70 family)